MTGRLCFLSLNALPYLSEHGPDFAGGAEAQEVRIAKGLAERGWRVSFLTEDHGQGELIRAAAIEIRATFRPRAGLPIARFIWPRLSSVRQALRATPADVYLTRTASIWSAVIAAHARAVGAASVLALSHDREAALRLRGFLNPRDRWLFRRGLHQVDRIIAQTVSQSELLRESTGLDSIIVPNGIDMESGSSPPFRPRSGPTRALWVGTLRPWKRPQLFVELAASLPEIEFTLIGGADPHRPGLPKWVRARAATLPNLEVLGYVAPQRIGGFFDRSDIFVSTSAAEGFPNTFLEAWVRGIPVVSMGADPQRAISNCGAGLLIRDARDLRATVAKLAADPDFASAVGLKCRKVVADDFSTQSLVDRYERICMHLMGRTDHTTTKLHTESGRAHVCS